MNERIRAYIRDHYQPWRKTPAESAYRGVIGDKGVLPVAADFRHHFADRGVSVAGRFAEDLPEDDLLESVQQTLAWLSPEQRASVVRLVP